MQVVVDGQANVLAGRGVLDAQVAHLAAVAVHYHVAGAVLSAQQPVVGFLHSCLAHHVAGFVGRIALLVEIFLAHLTHVPDQVGCKSIPRVEAPHLIHRLQFRQLVAMGLDEGLFIVGNVQLDGDRLVTRRGAIAAQGGAQVFQVQVQAVGNQRQVGVYVAALLANHEAGD